MASSSGRDKETEQKNTQPKPENPFIQFRQFADTQISSLLQGIIGLPSAFSRRQAEDGRWAEIDDDLRRRDDMQARRKELRESEARRLNRHTLEENGVAAATKSTNERHTQNWETQSSASRNGENGVATKDLPLYSPITKSLFAHLRQRDEDEADWNEMGNKTFWKPKIDQQPFNSDQDPEKVTQYMVYHTLNNSTQLRSEYSLLPYLMFSPYSPLRLGRSQRFTSLQTKDDFPYAEAFADLVKTLQEIPPSPLSRFIPSRLPLAGHPVGDMLWISKLHALGILQPQDTRYNAFLSTILRAGSPEEEQKTTDTASGPRTEQDMYENFLQWASSPSPITEALRAGEAFLASLENGGTVPRERDQENGVNSAPLGIMKEIFEAAKDFREISDSSNDQLETSKEHHPLAKSGQTNSTEDRDRIVSTSTTSERTVHEDGTVETSITVWRRYSNGRETSTTTHHCEDPAFDENSAPKIEQKENPGSVGNEKKVKSGWFWN